MTRREIEAVLERDEKMKAEIEAILERVKTWSKDRQEEIAEIILEMDSDPTVYRLSDEERRDIRLGVAEADRGEFASPGQLREILTPQR